MAYVLFLTIHDSNEGEGSREIDIVADVVQLGGTHHPHVGYINRLLFVPHNEFRRGVDDLDGLRMGE